jgi:hypothetical protein
MKRKAIWKWLHTRIRRDRMDSAFDNAPCVAVLAGDPLVIEAVVQKAAMDSGIEMDWSYVGGRAVIRSHGDRTKCRLALKMAIPQSDLTERDLVVQRCGQKT